MKKFKCFFNLQYENRLRFTHLTTEGTKVLLHAKFMKKIKHPHKGQDFYSKIKGLNEDSRWKALTLFLSFKSYYTLAAEELCMYEEAHKHPCIFICSYVQKASCFKVNFMFSIFKMFMMISEYFHFLPVFFYAYIAIKFFQVPSPFLFSWTFLFISA